LIDEVCAGKQGVAQRPGDSFPTDGRLYVFSALQPAPPPSGSLRLVIVRQSQLAGAVLGLVVLLGVLLLPARRGPRALVGGGLLILLVLCGMFWPIAARQLLNGALAAAVLVVLIVWGVWHFVRGRPARGEKPAEVEKTSLPPPEAPAAEQAPAAAGEEGGKSHE
jgi:hypothetical protein